MPRLVFSLVIDSHLKCHMSCDHVNGRDGRIGKRIKQNTTKIKFDGNEVKFVLPPTFKCPMMAKKHF